MTLWTIDSARQFCLKLHQYLEPLGYDVGLAGGILIRGESEKDIDVIVYPMKRLSANFDVMRLALPNFGLKYVRLPNKNLGYADDGKRVEVWEYEGKRVDLFFLA